MTGNAPLQRIAILLSLAFRNLWRHRKRTIITLASIALGFGIAVFSIGLSDGSHNSMIRNAIQLGEGHLTVQAPTYLSAPANHKILQQGQQLEKKLESLLPEATIIPRVSLQVLAMTAHNSVGLLFDTLTNEHDPKLKFFQSKLSSGQLPIEPEQIALGVELARKLRVKLGSKVVIMLGKKDGESQSKLVRVSGIFQSGLNEIDGYLILGQLALGQSFLIDETVSIENYPLTRFAIFLDQADSLPEKKNLLRQTINNKHAVVLDWQEMLPQLVQFIAIDDAGNYVFLSLIFIVVVVGIINTVLMSVLERTREFGLLRALGMGRYELLLMVFFETILLGLFALLLGWLLGASIHAWFSVHGIDFSGLMSTEIAGTHMDTIIYTELSMDRVFQISAFIFLSTVISGIYPALKAMRITPVNALQT